MESRKGNQSVIARKTASPLPVDYLKMVKEVFTSNFDEGLKALSKIKSKTEFHITGSIFLNELVLAASIIHKDQLSATTVYASADFDPKASSPTVQDLLGACVDAIGGILEQLLDPKDTRRLEQLADESLSALENVPFEWTSMKVDKHTLYVKIDKANPNLDQMADDWLSQNDPELAEREREEEEETEQLFVTGPRRPKNSGGQIH
jgi:hypothetical protein